MKLCFIIKHITVRAGTERAQVNLANALVARGHSVSIWSLYRGRESSGFPLASDVKVSYGLKRRLPFFLDYPLLMCAFALYVIRERPRWIICTDTNRLIVALLAVFVPGVQLAVWEHYAVGHSVTKARGRLARSLAVKLAKRIVTLTERDAAFYAERYAPSGQVLCIPNIVSRPEIGKTVRVREVLAVGRFTHQKGFDLLLDAWAVACRRLPEWSLRIVGGGELRDQLLLQAHKLGIEQSVTFTPYSDNPFALYAECGMFVLSSRFEGLPFVLIEAMVCGTPCISFDCPNGPRELIEPGVNGVLVPAEQVESLANAIVELGEHPELRQKLGDEAEHIAKRFSEASIAARWLEILCG